MNVRHHASQHARHHVQWEIRLAKTNRKIVSQIIITEPNFDSVIMR